MKRTATTLLLLFAWSAILTAAEPSGTILVKGVADRYKEGNNNQRTSGLTNVGVGERIVFMAQVTDGTGYRAQSIAVTSATWSVLLAPTGSTAPAPQDTAAGLNGTIVYFVPDLVGTYTIQMSALTDSGAAPPVNLTLTVGTFRGVGNYNLSTGEIDNFNCAPCHTTLLTEVFSAWTGTGHASAMARKIDTPGGYFSNGCLPCHSVGWDTAASAANGGFDDIMPEGFAIPTPGYPGLYDSLVSAEQGLMALGSIQCENCHGPAEQHASTGDATKLAKSYSADVCGVCHIAAGNRHQQGFAWTGSGHSGSMSSSTTPQSRNRPLCNRCHTAQGYVNQVIKGNPEPVVPEGEPIWENGQSITCVACHDPHSDANPHQLRVTSVDKACTGCHTIRITSRGLHGNHQGMMVLGVNAESYSGQEGPVGDWSGWELPGYTYQNATHSSIEELCVQCHMAHSPTYDPTYATPDTLVNRLGDHSFAVVWDNDTPDDESDDILNSTGCQDCHGVVGLQFVRLSQGKIQNLLDTLKSYLPQQTSGNSAGEPIPFNSTTDTLSPIQRAASYNYYFVRNDGTFGVHNHSYARGLLESSIEQVKLGQGAGSILSIADIPADQGGQVQIVWSQFPAELFSFARAEAYGVWRLDQNLSDASEGKIPSVSTYQQMLTAGPVGTTVQLGEFVSTYVGSVPSTGLNEYAFVAPTIVDSTVNDGLRYSHFVIAAYSAGNATVYLSAPDSGYSVDNLNPVQPSGLAAGMVETGVRLTWDAPVDPDISFYGIYRSTTPGFDPSGLEPLGTAKGTDYTDMAVQTGMQYYYRIAAFDFAGNQSPYSEEVTLLVTGIREDAGIPTEFALRQNYPNPFNPSTHISFALPQASPVTLAVYSISGELVTMLVSRELAAGYYTVVWDGTSDLGLPVGSGMYLYRIQAGSFTSTHKMVLVK